MTRIPIGILGGTFDPVHFGHLRLALEARLQLGLQEVRLTPLYQPPHRKPPVASAEQRLRMLRLAVRRTSGLIVDRCELARKGKSYTIDTVRLLRDNYPDRSLCLIVGMDEFSMLDGWKDWSLLLDYVHILVAERPGRDHALGNPALNDLYHSRLRKNTSSILKSKAGFIFRMKVPLLEISASRIRKLIHEGHSIKYLLPDNVIDYIQKEKIYQ